MKDMLNGEGLNMLKITIERDKWMDGDELG